MSRTEEVMQHVHRGVRQVVSYHWPFYLFALAACIGALGLLTYVPMGTSLTTIITIGFVAAAYWLVVGTLAVWYVFDLSPLTRWQWIPDVLRIVPSRWGNLHVGGDEATPTLRALYPHSVGDEIDFFDPALVTEPGLLRLRRQRDASNPTPLTHLYDWSAEEASWDVAFLIFAAHEMRTHEARVALLSRVRQGLRSGGKILLVEHFRDPFNFLAFGPAFTHFFSRDAWTRAADDAGFTIARDKKVNLLVHAVVLESRF